MGQAFTTTACNGKVTGEDCLVECAEGWINGGNPATFTCGTNGNFSGTAPACTPRACTSGAPQGNNLNATSCIGVTTLDTCSVSCAGGYTGSPKAYTCQTTGVFVGSPPSCQVDVCPNSVPSFPGVKNNCDNITVGSTCTLSCDTGYQLPSGSPPTWTCNYDASAGSSRLSGTAPTCQPQACTTGLPGGSQYSHNCSSMATGQSCQVSCAAGHDVTTETFTCAPSGLVLGSMPTCNPSNPTTTLTTTAPTPPSSSQTLTFTGTFMMTAFINNLEIPTLSFVQAFINDPDVTRGVETGIADMASVLADQVSATLSLVRRLEFVQAPRLLTWGSVRTDYVVTVPAGSPASGPRSAAYANSQLAAANTNSMQSAVNAGLQQTSPGMSVAVSSYSAPSAVQGQPQPSPPPPCSTEEEDDTVPVEMIAGGIVGGCVLCLLCGIAATLLKKMSEDNWGSNGVTETQMI